MKNEESCNEEWRELFDLVALNQNENQKGKKNQQKKKTYFWSDFCQELFSSCEADKLLQMVLDQKKKYIENVKFESQKT